VMHRTILILLYGSGIRRAELRWLMDAFGSRLLSAGNGQFGR
jgi:hypothetical protein